MHRLCIERVRDTLARRAGIFTALVVGCLCAAVPIRAQSKVLRFTYITSAMAGPAPAFDLGSELTIEGFVFLTGDELAYATLLNRADTNGNLLYSAYFQDYAGNEAFCMYVSPGGHCAWAPAATVLVRRSWLHLAAVYTAASVKLYVGGTEVLATTPPTLVPVGSELGPVGVGMNFPAAARDLRLWHRALGGAEIAAIAAGGEPSSNTSLGAHWPLGDGTGQVAADLSPNANALVLGSTTDLENFDPRWVPLSLLESGPYFELKWGGAQLGAQDLVVDADGDGLSDVVRLRGLPTPWDCDYPYYDPENPPAQAVAQRSDGFGHLVEDASIVEFELFAGGFRNEVGDFNGDGNVDLLVIDSGPECQDCCPPAGSGPEDFPGGQARLFVGQPDGPLVEETLERMPTRRAYDHGGAAGDIDGDGDRDIYLGTADDKDLADCMAGDFHPGIACPGFLINDGTGHFVEDYTRLPFHVASYREGTESRYYLAAHLADFDRDGDVDLVLGGFGGDQSEPYDPILWNDGTGHFTRAPEGTTPDRPHGLTSTQFVSSADFNADGLLDIVGTQYHGRSLQLNNGDGTFRDASSALDQPVPEGKYFIRCIPADLNRDGFPDLVCDGSATLRFYYNLGDETFEEMPLEYDTIWSWDAYPANGNGDNKVDVILGGDGFAGLYTQIKPYFPPSAKGVFYDGFESGNKDAWLP